MRLLSPHIRGFCRDIPSTLARPRASAQPVIRS
jgi:hypothetical protein